MRMQAVMNFLPTSIPAHRSMIAFIPLVCRRAADVSKRRSSTGLAAPLWDSYTSAKPVSITGMPVGKTTLVSSTTRSTPSQTRGQWHFHLPGCPAGHNVSIDPRHPRRAVSQTGSSARRPSGNVTTDKTTQPGTALDNGLQQRQSKCRVTGRRPKAHRSYRITAGTPVPWPVMTLVLNGPKRCRLTRVSGPQ